MSRMTISEQNGALVLAGAIDETATIPELVARARGGQLVLDLGGITFINSLGVRDWIRMVATAQQNKIQLELRRVSEPIIHQLNMIIATRGNARVTSFFAPYACDACGREESLLIEPVAKLEPPPQTCPECGAAMVFNDFPERYFSFLS